MTLGEMSEADVMALEAGPDTDALVAEVFGWTAYLEWIPATRPRLALSRPPRYSREIAAAYEAEEMVPDGFRGQYTVILCEVVAKYWDDPTFEMIHATPLQRSIALLLWAKRRDHAIT